MADNHTFKTDASFEISDGVANYQVFSDEAGVTVRVPHKFVEDGDTRMGITVTGDHDWTEGESDAWASAGISLTLEQAREVGEFLIEASDKEPYTMMDGD